MSSISKQNLPDWRGVSGWRENHVVVSESCKQNQLPHKYILESLQT